MIIQIPKRFIDDHDERALPTPERHRATDKHYFIMADDPALPELVDDARHYATGGTDCPKWLIQAAQALLNAIERQTDREAA